MTVESYNCKNNNNKFSLLFIKFNFDDLVNLQLLFHMWWGIFQTNLMDVKVYWNYTDILKTTHFFNIWKPC